MSLLKEQPPEQTTWMEQAKQKLKWQYFIGALLGISLIIIVHELGHWTFCKLFGVGVPSFSVGLGPTLIEKKWGGTTFSLSLLPIGGYVAILGRHGIALLNPTESFVLKPLYQQLLILFGGIIFNILLSLFLLWLSGEKIRNLLPQNRAKKYRINLIGPLGIIKLISQKIAQGYTAFFLFLSWLSLNLALFNLIPLPLLDGGQALILIIEKIIHHPLPEKSSIIISIISLVILGLFLLYTLVQDFKNILKKDRI